MVLVCDDVDADVIAQAVLIEDLIVEPRSDLRVAILIRQAGPDRLGLFQDLVRDEGVGVLTVVPQFH
jgi:hypothetical protein